MRTKRTNPYTDIPRCPGCGKFCKSYYDYEDGSHRSDCCGWEVVEGATCFKKVGYRPAYKSSFTPANDDIRL